jgi:aminopeptidase-like protein
MPIKDIIQDLYMLDFAPVSPAADLAIGRFRDELDFQVHEVPSGTEKNGWLVPDSWSYSFAEIRKDGRLIYDGRAHPLGVVGYSPSYKGRVDLKTLKDHLFFSADRPDDLVFHCTHYFRPLEKSWGFCVPMRLYETLEEGWYDVDIRATSEPGTMKILEYTLPGTSTDTIVLHGHNCHPGQANDDLSGCAVGIEFMKRLKEQGDLRYTYTLLISPELFGTFYWLDRLPEERIQQLKYAIMLKSVGNENPLKLQLSYPGNTLMDLAARNALRSINRHFQEGPFRRVYGNDETLFEAPGYEVPTISLTRYPFPEYHSNSDTPAILSEKNLTETVEVLLEISGALEKNARLMRNFKGLLGLSHPRYNLYQPFWNPAAKTGPQRGEQPDWHFLMIDMFRDFDGKISILEIAERHRLPFPEVFEYLAKLRNTGAISFMQE